MIILLSTPYSEASSVEFEISESNRIMSDDLALEIIDNLCITKYTTRGLRILADEIDAFKLAIRNNQETHIGNLFSYIEMKEE